MTLQPVVTGLLELWEHGSLDIDTLHRAADLAAVVQRVADGIRRRRLEVSVSEDHHGVLAPSQG